MDNKRAEDVRKAAAAVLKELAEQGKTIEGGWRAMVIVSGLDQPGIAELQRSEMRKAYFHGAAHLFASIMSTLDPEAEPTEADLRRVGLIHKELEKFVEECKAQKGN